MNSSHRRRLPRLSAVRPIWWLTAGFMFAVAGLIWYSLASGEGVYASTGDSYPGALTAVTEPIGCFTAALAGAVTFGGLLYVAMTARPDARTVIDERAFGTHVTVERAAAVWAFTAIVMIVVQAANDAGAPVTELIASPGLLEAVLVSEMARAWVAAATMSVVVAVTVRLSVRWLTHVVLLVP
ncbi:MAG TPA: cytochrome c oxidase assembly protein, partial [Mycobacterium sp.]|nr:cytochrome c oxidase assembly protein [Mycobacterium sp.]